MIAAIRLLTFGSRGEWGRLTAIAAGVAAGVLVVLMLIAGSNALEARDMRGAWLYHPSGTTVIEPGSERTMVATSSDLFEGHRIVRQDVSVAASGVQLPGIDDAPAPGEFLASPALAALIAQHPTELLADRYGTLSGQIPESLLPSSETLAVIVGVSPEAISARASALAVSSFEAQAFDGNRNYQALAVIGAIALLLPAFLLVSVATSLGASARSERTQTLRTIGASRRFLILVAAIEAGLSSAIGALAGVALFFSARPLLALLRVAGERLVAADLTVDAFSLMLVVIVVIAGSIIAATWSASRARSHATTTQAVFERAPRIWRIVPFIVGLTALIVIRFAGDALPVPPHLAVIVCFAVLAVGLVIAGPCITYLTGKIFSSVATGAAGVLASRRIVRTPAAVFRSVAGLVAATFLVSLFSTAVTAQVDAGSFGARVLLPADAVAIELNPTGPRPVSDTEVQNALTSGLQAIGVHEVIVARGSADGVFLFAKDAARLNAQDIPAGELVSVVGGVFSLAPDMPALASAETVESDEISRMPVAAVIVRTDGTPESLERARTALLALPGVDPSFGAWTRAEYVSNADSNLATQFAEIGRFAILVATLLAAAVLVVSTIAALYDRRRTFALLRLIGMPTRVLLGLVARETLVPLIGITLIAAGSGCLTAWLLVTSLSADRTIGWPDALMPTALAATALMAVIAIWIATIAGRRLLQREQVRFE